MSNIMKKLNHYLDRLRCGDGHDLARLMKSRGVFHGQGDDCYIDFSVTVDEPYLVTMGRNVWLTDDVKILTHDGALTMLGRIRGESLRKFGAVRLGDNVFVGMSSVLLPGVRLGDKVVVAAGSVVTKDVPSGCIVGGNPARVLGRVEDYLEKWRHRQEPFAYQGAADKVSHLVDSLMGEVG